jgi:Zn-dependent peptidase ImmA (M78 family)
MILKKSFNVFGVKYKLKIVDMSPQGYAGLCDREKKIIYIDTSLVNDEAQLYTTLAHELGHAMFFEASIIQAGIPHEVEEIIVDLISKIVYSEILLPILKEIPPPLPCEEVEQPIK